MLPLIYLVGAGIAGLLVVSTKGFGFWGEDENGDPILEKKLAVLGPQGSGKTFLFNSLLERPNTKYRSSKISGENIGELIIKEGDKTIKLIKTLDVPGSDQSVKLHYESLISSCSDLFFILNSSKYFNEESYKLNVMAMLHFIIRHKNKENKIILIGSHIDEILKTSDSKDKREDMANEIMDSLVKEFGLNHFRNIELLNLLDKEEIVFFKKSLFK